MAKIYWNNLDAEIAQQIKDSFAGILTPDGTTITADQNGVISAVAGAGYQLPTASTTVLGGVKVDGTTITIDANGVITAIQGTPISVINDLTTGGTTDALSAEQGKVLKGFIDTLTSGKIDKTDIVNDLTTGGIQKVLSAEQGKAIMALIEANKMKGEEFTTDEKAKLAGIAENANNYTLPAATDATIGGVKPDGTTITVTADGTITAISTGGVEFTQAEKDKLGLIEAEANKYVLPEASTTVVGGIKVDGTSIKITNGVISTEVADLTGYVKTVNTTLVPDGAGNITLTIGDLDGYTKAETDAAIKVTDDKVVAHVGDGTVHMTTAEKTKLAGIEAEANKYTLPVATDTVLGGIKQGTGMTITADGTANINFPTVVQPQFGEFIATTTADATHDFIYTPDVVLKPEDTVKNLIVVYNTTTLKSTEFSIEEVGGVRVIVLNVEEADTVARNSVAGFVLRGFAPLS